MAKYAVEVSLTWFVMDMSWPQGGLNLAQVATEVGPRSFHRGCLASKWPSLGLKVASTWPNLPLRWALDRFIGAACPYSGSTSSKLLRIWAADHSIGAVFLRTEYIFARRRL